MDYSKYFKVINLNNSWVITKRHNGNIFFKRKKYAVCAKNYPTKDCIYLSEDEVRQEVALLNSKRKKCKYGYENASKYFVNNWNFNRWDGNVIKNEAIPIKDIDKETKITNFNMIKKYILEDLIENIKNKNEYIKQIQEEMPKKLKELEERFKSNIEEQKKILASERSNNFLDTRRLESLYKVKNIKDSVRDILYKMKENREI